MNVMEIVTPTTKKWIIIFLILLVAGVTVGAYFFLKEKNARDRNNYPNKNATPNEFTILKEKGYYSNASYLITENKTLESLVFIDSTLTEISTSGDLVKMKLQIRTFDKAFEYSLSTKYFFVLENLSTNPKTSFLDISSYNKISRDKKYQAIFLYSSNKISITTAEIKTFCKKTDLDASLKIFCSQISSDENYQIPYFQYLDDLKIDNESYFENLIFVGYII